MTEAFEAEQCVLGCLMLDAAEVFPKVQAAGIGVAHFHDLRHRAIYKVLARMHEEGLPIESASVWLRAKSQGLAENSEQLSYLAGLPESVASASSVTAYLPELVDAHHRRMVIEVARRLFNLVKQKEVAAAQLMSDAETAVRVLRQVTAQETYTVRAASDLVAEVAPENDNILGDRLLARGQSLTLLGPGGIGKSRLLLQMAACHITGRPFIGLRTQQAGLRWLVLQTENSNRRLQQDLDHLRSWLGRDEWEEVGRQLFLHTLEKGHDSFVQLDAPQARQRLADQVERCEAGVVCFDPLNCFGSGDLNSDSDMRQTCAWITEICRSVNPECAIVVLHHALTGRAGAARATGYDRASFGRNSKLLHAWTRGQINLAPAHPTQNQQLIVSCGKCSNGEEFQPFAIRLDPEQMIYHPDPGFDLAGWEKEMTGQKPDPLDRLIEQVQAPTSRQAAAEQLINSGFSRATAYRAIHEALAQNLLEARESMLHPAPR